MWCPISATPTTIRDQLPELDDDHVVVEPGRRGNGQLHRGGTGGISPSGTIMTSRSPSFTPITTSAMSRVS
ncbi:MAG: hypothetical protein WDN27_01935 [Candidatus Saccharibacteria bacterium]